jgi:hypothetical protein
MPTGLFLVFNELSDRPIAADRNAAARLMESLSGIIVDSRCRFATFVTPSYFLQSEIAPGYSIGRWISTMRMLDGETRTKLKLFFANRMDFEGIDVESQRAGAEYTFEQQPARGLGIADVRDGLAVSLKSHSQWDNKEIEVERASLGSHDVEIQKIHVRNAADNSHLNAHEAFFEQFSAEKYDGDEVWEQRKHLFPSLDFCDEVAGQLIHLSRRDPNLKAVVRGLGDLQAFCNAWQDPFFDIHSVLSASGESESTMNMFSAERTFLCPDGVRRIFEWHVKRGQRRIHFIEIPSTKRLLIGYAGAHLPISSS